MKRVYTNQILRYLGGNIGTLEQKHNLVTIYCVSKNNAKCIMKLVVFRHVRKIAKSDSDSTGRIFMKFDI